VAVGNSGGAIRRVRLKRHVRDLDPSKSEAGGSQPKILEGEDGTFWLVKVKNNPQGMRTLANELVGATLARRIGATVPEPAICELPADLAVGLTFADGRTWESGLVYGSALLESSWEPTPEILRRAANPAALQAVVAADTWLGLFDSRQARAVADGHGGFTIWAVDFGYTVGAPNWSVQELTVRGDPADLHDPSAWISLAPPGTGPPLALTVQSVSNLELRELAYAMPSEWLVLPTEAESLAAYLIRRRPIVAALLGRLN
jgi:hypothetical protein